MRTVRALLLGSAAAACVVAAAPAGAAPYLYVTDFGGSVSAYDGAAGALNALKGGSVRTGSAPVRVAVTPDGTSVYVTNKNDATVSEYDVAADCTRTPKAMPAVNAGQQPDAVAVNPDGKAVYVANYKDGTVSQYDIGPGAR